ncbi:MAG: hypothetical protein HQK77_14160 [Desulfobacterales bacterium]|nr:hypothetical protein [Desulfobacterales bacterium]
MRKFLTVICVVCLFLMVGGTSFAADAKTYQLGLGSANSGNSTSYGSSTGTSVFAVLNGPDIVLSGTSSISIATTEGQFYVVQLTAVTPTQAAQGKGGSNTGTTLTLLYRESNRDTPMHWALAEKKFINGISGVALSGGTFYASGITPYGHGFIRFETWLSSTTGYDNITFDFICK